MVEPWDFKDTWLLNLWETTTLNHLGSLVPAWLRLTLFLKVQGMDTKHLLPILAKPVCANEAKKGIHNICIYIERERERERKIEFDGIYATVWHTHKCKHV